MKRVLNFMRNPKLAHILVKNDPLDQPKKMPTSKKLYIFRKLVKTQNGDQNRINPSFTLQTAKFVPFKSVLKNDSASGKKRVDRARFRPAGPN